MPAPRRVRCWDLALRTVGVSEESMLRMARGSAEDILRVLPEERPKFPCSREALKR